MAHSTRTAVALALVLWLGLAVPGARAGLTYNLYASAFDGANCTLDIYIPTNQTWSTYRVQPFCNDDIVEVGEEVVIAGKTGMFLAYAPINNNEQPWLSAGAFSGPVFGLSSQFNSTTVYVGGNFSTVDDIACNNIAKFTPDGWSAMGGGFSAPVLAIVQAIVAGTEIVIAGGMFNDEGGLAYVAAWAGEGWMNLEQGLSDVVTTLAVTPSGALFAGGLFLETGASVAVNHIARFDTFTGAWYAMGAGTNGVVNAMAAVGSFLYVGGEFTTAGGVSTPGNVARWNGVAWSAVGNSGYARITSMVALNATLVVADSSDNSTHSVSIWNGTAWQTTTQLRRPVTALLVAQQCTEYGTYGIDCVSCGCGPYGDCTSSGILGTGGCTCAQGANVTASASCHVCNDAYNTTTGCSTCLHGKNAATNCTTCQDANYAATSNCTTCANMRDLATGCTNCLNNYDLSTGCTVCLNHYNISTQCTTCDAHYHLYGYCTGCSGNFDPSTNCTGCLPNSTYAPAYDRCISCDLYGVNSPNVDPLTDCTTCVNPYLAWWNNCGSCVSGNFNYSALCLQCDNHYNFSTGCSSCLRNYAEYSACTECLVNYDPSTECTQCEVGYDIAHNCTACAYGYVNIGGACVAQCAGANRDPAYACNECLSGWNITTNCTTCLTRYCGTNCQNRSPYDCFNGGVSVCGLDGEPRCVCNGNYSGAYCETCAGGLTRSSNCTSCPEGYDPALNCWGENPRVCILNSYCTTCLPGFWGAGCLPCTSCDGGRCDDGLNGTGACVCNSPGGDIRTGCEECLYGFYGPDCVPCLSCGDGQCFDGRTGNGTCHCYADHDPTTNCTDCLPGFYGPTCLECISCNVHGTCIDGAAGSGACACDAGWSAQYYRCNNCDLHSFGPTCEACPCNIFDPCMYGIENTGECRYGPGYNVTNGTAGCFTGFSELSLCTLCEAGFYGPNCTACNCGVHGICNDTLTGNGNCTCKFGGDPFTHCSTCINGTYSLTVDGTQLCIACGCGDYGCTNSSGAYVGCVCPNNNFDPSTACRQCKPTFYGPSCAPCGCSDLRGTLWCEAGIGGNGSCVCRDGYDVATNCSACLPGHYGEWCQPCDSVCANGCFEGRSGNGSCVCAGSHWDPETGCTECYRSQWIIANVTTRFGQQPGYYGPNCTYACSDCSDRGLCSSGLGGNGACICDYGADPSTNCSTCLPGFYGPDCLQCLGCSSGAVCLDGVAGNGTCACPSAGFADAHCTFCKPFHYGPSCLPCPSACRGSNNDQVCDQGLEGSGACSCWPPGFNTATGCSTCTLPRFTTASNCNGCIANYDPSTNCTACLPHFSLESGCTTCLFGYSQQSNCGSCIANYNASVNCGACNNKYSLVSNCTACASNYNVTTGCTACKRNWDITTDCGSCIGNYASGTSCTTCIHNYNISTQCTKCIEHYDITTQCFGCLPGYNLGTACTACLFGYQPNTNCTLCAAGLDISTECTTCLNGNYAPPSCATCLENYNISTGCAACISGYDVNTHCTQCTGPGYYDPDAGCAACMPRYNISTTCTTCLGPGLFDPGTNCEVCVSGYNISTNCTTCTGPGHFSLASGCTACDAGYAGSGCLSVVTTSAPTTPAPTTAAPTGSDRFGLVAYYARPDCSGPPVAVTVSNATCTLAAGSCVSGQVSSCVSGVTIAAGAWLARSAGAMCYGDPYTSIAYYANDVCIPDFVAGTSTNYAVNGACGIGSSVFVMDYAASTNCTGVVVSSLILSTEYLGGFCPRAACYNFTSSTTLTFDFAGPTAVPTTPVPTTSTPTTTAPTTNAPTTNAPTTPDSHQLKSTAVVLGYNSTTLAAYMKFQSYVATVGTAAMLGAGLVFSLILVV